MLPPTRNPGWVGFAHLLIVYLVWGSTFLAIRFGVQGEGAIPPMTLAASRVLVSGIVLLCIGVLSGAKVHLTPKLLLRLAGTGCLFWIGGHALLIWAAQWTDSGYTALVFGSVPLWTVVLDSLRRRSRPSLSQASAVGLGFVGIALLSAPELSGGRPNALASTLVLSISAACWAAASLLQSEEERGLPVTISAGFQQLFSGAICALGAWLLGEKLGAPSPKAVMAWIYLTTVGSVLAFTSYIRATRLLPGTWVASFAYVNPMIAVALGTGLFGERLTAGMALGMVMIAVSVVWIFRTDRTGPGVLEQKGNEVKHLAVSGVRKRA